MFKGSRNSKALVYLDASNADDMELLYAMRKSLNKEFFAIRVRGRHSDRQMLANLGLARRYPMSGDRVLTVPIKYAEHLSVYIKYKIWRRCGAHFATEAVEPDWWNSIHTSQRERTAGEIHIKVVGEDEPVFNFDSSIYPHFALNLANHLNARLYEMEISPLRNFIIITRKPEFKQEALGLSYRPEIL